MIKNECEIVKDMLPSYVENTLSSATNEFIETHIKECKNCKKILDELKKESIVEKDQDKKSKKNKTKDIDYLKKYNRRIKLLTSIVYILIIFIILVLFFSWYTIIKNYNFYSEYKTKYDTNYNTNYNIIHTAYNKTNEMLNETNYLFSADYGNEKSMSFYYKDGKFKKVDKNFDKTDKEQCVEYGMVVENGYRGLVFNYWNDGGIYRILDISFSGKILSDKDVSIYLNSFYNLNLTELINLEITNEVYNNTECYLVKKYENDDKSQWKEMWIDKDTMLVVREKNNEKDNNWDYRYMWTVGNVTDEDVTITDTTRQDWLPFYNEILDMLLEK